jgi:hypothetical protein
VHTATSLTHPCHATLPQALARVGKLPNSAPLQYQALCRPLGYDNLDMGSVAGPSGPSGPPASVEELAGQLAGAVAGGQPGAVASLLECVSAQISQERNKPGRWLSSSSLGVMVWCMAAGTALCIVAGVGLLHGGRQGTHASDVLTNCH